ncbi:MAG: tetratricopeptide repeat protein [Thalassobaculaceae bacterium]
MDAEKKSGIVRRWAKPILELVNKVTGLPVDKFADAVTEQVEEFLRNTETPPGPDAVRASIFRSKPKFAPALAGSEGTLLRAERGIVPFGQRDADLIRFRDWFNDDMSLRWWLMTGPSGRGKTRFMQHIVDTFEPFEGRQLFAGFIDLSALIDAPEVYGALMSHTGDILFVVDYAERARAQTEAVLQLSLMLWEAAREGHDIRVRVVLIARSRSEVWNDIGSKNEAIGNVLNATGGEFIEAALPPLADSEEERRAEFARAFRAFDQALDADSTAGGRWPEEHQIPDLAPRQGRDDFKEAVMIHLAALAAVRGAMSGSEMTDASLLKWIIGREREEWYRRASGLLGLKSPALERALDEAVGVVTLAATASQEPSEARTVELLRTCPHLQACSDDDLEALAEKLAELHPGEAGPDGEAGPIGLMPDIVGTYFLGDRRLDEAFYRAVLGALNEQEARNALTKLNWLAQNWKEPDQRANPDGEARILAAISGNAELALPVVIDVAQQSGDPIGAIAAGLVEGRDDADLARYLEQVRGFPQQTVALRELAVAVETILFRAEADEKSDNGRSRRAARANDLSVRLSALGRWKAALTAIDEAVDLYRTLAAKRPDTFTPSLARSLNNLSVSLSDLGREDEALEAIEEAIALYRTLIPPYTKILTSSLANALNNLSNILANETRSEDALTAIEEAVELFKKLAQHDPDLFTPELADSYNTLSSRLAGLDRREEALSAAQEAVGINRKLALENPDAFIPNLASSLNNVAGELAALGYHSAAIDSVDEAIALYNGLAEVRPNAFRDVLATSWGSRGEVLLLGNRPDEAAESFNKFLSLIAPLIEEFPQAFARQAIGNTQHYVAACEAAGIEPDMDLLGPILQTLEEHGLIELPDDTDDPDTRPDSAP